MERGRGGREGRMGGEREREEEDERRGEGEKEGRMGGGRI